MLELLKKVLQVGEATVRYPDVPLNPIPSFRGKPVYHNQACIACGACAGACPANAITIEHNYEEELRSWTLNYGRCIFCGRCEEVCPTGALALSTDCELAASHKRDLMVTADFQLQRCRICNQLFAPARELEYLFRLIDAGGPGNAESSTLKEILQTCPDCRRKNNVVQLVTGGRLAEGRQSR